MTDAPVEQPKKGMPGWVIALLVVAGIGLLCVVGSGIAAAVMVLVPKIQVQQKMANCADNLRQMGAAYMVDTMERGGTTDEGGAAYFVGLVEKSGGGGQVLLCPGDDHGPPQRIRMDDADTVAALRAKCSYAVRDFARYPLDPDSAVPEMVAADVGEHHRGGINVLYVDGSVRFTDRRRLGMAADDPIVVGPDSPHPELRKLCIVPAR